MLQLSSPCSDFFALQVLCFWTVVDLQLSASNPGCGLECVSCYKKKKRSVLLWLKNCLPFQSGWSGGNTATALWQVTQQTAALLLLSLPWMPGNQLDEGSNFLICKPTLLHFDTDFLWRRLHNSSQNPGSAVAFHSPFHPRSW